MCHHFIIEAPVGGFYQIVYLVYNYRISLLENFTGDTKNVIIFLQSDRFC